MDDHQRHIFKIFITGLNYFFQAAILLVPFMGSIFDKRRKGLKKIKRLGWYFIFCFLGFVACSICLAYITDIEGELRQKAFEKGLEKRDSINGNKIEKSDKETIELLAKYGLEQNESAKRIERIVQDSTKKTVKIYNSVDPYFSLCNILVTKSGDTIKIKPTACSKEATTYDLNIKADLYGFDEGFKTIYDIGPLNDFILIGSKLKQNEELSTEFEFKYKFSYDFYIVHIYGYYRKFDGKLIKTSEFFSYSIKDKQFGTPRKNLNKLLLDHISKTQDDISIPINQENNSNSHKKLNKHNKIN